jgi:hypothetical protein
MHGPEIFVPIAFFVTVATIIVGLPLARAYARRMERSPQGSLPAETAARLERMEQAIESIAVEVERISEGQRFVTKLLAERTRDQLPAAPDPSR